MAMFSAFFEIGLLLVLIVGCCSFFTNAIEWVGHRFNLSEGAVGSVLAAVGTALPETLVPLISIGSGMLGISGMNMETGHDIGIGAILGAPFLLGTLAMFVTAAAVYYFSTLKKRDKSLHIHMDLFRRDFHYFFPAYLLVFAAAFIPSMLIKQVIAVLLLSFYGYYVYRTINKEHMPDAEFDLAGLYLSPKTKEPKTALILLQVALSLVGLMILVHFFVDRINVVAGYLHIPSLVLSLIITPLATEMPEKFNSVVWISTRKDGLALGNITGAMVFQSCIPTAIGLLGTPWVLNNFAFTSVGLCMASSLVIYLVASKFPRFLTPALLTGGVFYLAFVIYAISGIK